MTRFSNRPDLPLSPEARRERLREVMAEIERQASLPAGHPEVLRAWGANERVPVPSWLPLSWFAHCLPTVRYPIPERPVHVMVVRRDGTVVDPVADFDPEGEP